MILNEREIYFIATLIPPYNIKPGGDGGYHSEESRKKMYVSMKGRTFTPETLQRMSEAQRRRFEDPMELQKARDCGVKRMTDESMRERISTSLKTYFDTEDTRARVSEIQKKRFQDENERLKISASVKARVEQDPEYIEKIRQSAARRSKSVIKLSMQGEVLYTYPSLSAAGIQAGHITSCCKGREKSAGGFKWQYA